MTAPITKRADQLAVGDRILHEHLPSPFFPEPGEVVFVKVHDYRKGRYVFVAYMQDNSFYDSTSYQPDQEVQVLPAPPAGHDYSRADDPEVTQPIAGRIPAHLEDGRTGEVVMVGGGAPKCSPECDAMTTRPEITGLARGWHHDDCPVAPLHEAADQKRQDDGGCPLEGCPPGFCVGADDCHREYDSEGNAIYEAG